MKKLIQQLIFLHWGEQHIQSRICQMGLMNQLSSKLMWQHCNSLQHEQNLSHQEEWVNLSKVQGSHRFHVKYSLWSNLTKHFWLGQIFLGFDHDINKSCQHGLLLGSPNVDIEHWSRLTTPCFECPKPSTLCPKIFKARNKLLVDFICL